MDVVARLTPFVIEVERQRRPVVIISHLSTMQVLLAYFKGVPLERCIEVRMWLAAAACPAVMHAWPRQYAHLVVCTRAALPCS